MLAFIGLFLAIMLVSMLGCRSPKTIFATCLLVGLVEMNLMN